ncbi:MAG: MarR family transcriptional regulator [Pseudomonadota bacterium]|nr:MarR family transcriptional regulator [Pseudomonadota bacterium]
MTLSLRAPRTVEQLLNYRLMRLYAEATGPVTRWMEGQWGISSREWRLLALLAVHDTLSPSALAEQAHLDRPRTSRAVTSLAGKGLARRQAQPQDGRRAQVGLTPAGKRLYDDIFPHISALNSRLMNAIDDATAAVLDHALEQLTVAAIKANRELAQDVRANRQAGGTRRVRQWAAR